MVAYAAAVQVIRVLAVYILVVFGGAALLAPWLWQAAQAVMPGSHLAGQPFHRYVNRCLLVLALAGLWPLVRALGIRSWAEIGADWRQWRRREAGLGVLIGFASLAAAALVVVLAGARHWNTDIAAAKLVSRLANAALSAVVVSLLEEILFRGAIYSAFRRSFGFISSALTVSAIYAIVHFFQRPPQPPEVNALTGFIILGQMLQGIADWSQIIPGFLNLTLVGLLLTWARERTGALWMSMGMHAGWIFWLKAYGTLTLPVAERTSLLWGTHKLYDGWVTSGVLVIVMAVLAWRIGLAKPNPAKA